VVARSLCCMPLPGVMCVAVIAVALAPREGLGHYLVRTTRAETFQLPVLELTATKLGEDAKEEVIVTAEEAPGWLPEGVCLHELDLQGPVEAAGVHLCGCWATEVAEGACVPCCHCIKRWRKDSTVVCWNELLRPGKCTRCREAHQCCVLVSPPSPCYCCFILTSCLADA
jgi:hypothetical protein